MFCIGWETFYRSSREFNGSIIAERVSQYVIASAHGLVHYKVVTNERSNKVRVFTDLDIMFKIPDAGLQSRELMKRHEQFSRTNREGAKNGRQLSSVPWSYLEDTWTQRPDLAIAIKSDEKAINAWNVITNIDTTPHFDDLISTASVITEERRAEGRRVTSLEMAGADPTWGQF
jgi:hypothetical protein